MEKGGIDPVVPFINRGAPIKVWWTCADRTREELGGNGARKCPTHEDLGISITHTMFYLFLATTCCWTTSKTSKQANKQTEHPAIFFSWSILCVSHSSTRVALALGPITKIREAENLVFGREALSGNLTVRIQMPGLISCWAQDTPKTEAWAYVQES